MAPYPNNAGNRQRIAAIYEYYQSKASVDVFLLKRAEKVDRQDFYHASNYRFSGLQRFIFKWAMAVKKKLHFRWKPIARKLGFTGLAYNNPLLLYRDGFDREALKQHLSDRQYDVVILNYAVYAYLYELFPKSTLKILDTHDRLSDRYRIYLDEQMKPPNWYSLFPEDEAKCLNAADVVWAITDEEKEFFQNTLGVKSKVERVMHFDSEVKALGTDSANDQQVLFVGSQNEININGLNWFTEKVWSDIVKKYPNAKLLAAGSVIKKKHKVTKVPQMELMGFFDEPEDVYSQAHICINPMPTGTGLKIKSVEALSYGKCLLTRTPGSVGLTEGVGSAFFASENVNEWVEELAKLLEDAQYRSTYQEKAIAFLKELNKDTLAVLEQYHT